MQRTPAQPAERCDPSTEQRGPSAEQHSQSAERSIQSAEQRAELISTEYSIEIELHGLPSDAWSYKDLSGFLDIRKKTERSLVQLRSQTKALIDTVLSTKAKENSVRRQVNFLNSAFKEYHTPVEKCLKIIFW